MEEKRPSILRVLQVDYPAFLAAVFPLVMWAIFAIEKIRRAAVPFNFFLVLLGITAAALLVLAWRITGFTALYNDGQEVPGVIHSVSFFRDRGRIQYIYTVQGQKYLGGNAVMKTARTKKYQPGEAVTLIVDRDNPKKACIQELYR